MPKPVYYTYKKFFSKWNKEALVVAVDGNISDSGGDNGNDDYVKFLRFK